MKHNLAVIVMMSVASPLNGYHKMKHNLAIIRQNQLEFFEPKSKTGFLKAVYNILVFKLISSVPDPLL